MMYDPEPGEKAYLLRDLGDDLIHRHHVRRLIASVFLCLGPLCDALLLWWITYADFLTSKSLLFQYFAVSYTAINVSTSFIGFWGMLFKNDAALRSSLALIVMQNTLMLIFTVLVLIGIVFKVNLFVLHHAPLFLQYLENNRKFGIMCCLIMIGVRTSCYLLVWAIGELETNCEKGDYRRIRTKKSVGDIDVDDNLHIQIHTDSD